MTIQLSSLRVSPEIEPSKYTAGAQQKVAADQAMAASSREVGQALAANDAKISAYGDSVSRLSAKYEPGARQAQMFARDLNGLNRALETGKITIEGASSILVGMNTRLGLAANSSELAARGQTQLAAAVKLANSQIEQQTVVAGRAIAVNDNMARFRRQNLMFQANDIGVSLAGGMNPGMVLFQQGSQIAQIYGGQGGVNALLKDAGSLAGGIVTRLGPVAAVAGVGALAIREMQSDIEKATGKSVTFGETFSAALNVVKSDIETALKPALDAISPWASAAWDKVSAGALLAGNTIINSFHAAYEDIKYLWAQFPNMIGSLVTQGVNAMVGGIQSMIQTGAGYIDTFIDKLNTALEKADKLMPGNGFRLGKIGTLDFGGPLQDPYTDELKRATDERNRRINEIMTSNPLGDYYRHVQKGAQDQVGFNLPSGGAGGAIPIPHFRGIDDVPGSVEVYDKLIKSGEIRIRQMQQERDGLGLLGGAAASLKFEQEALNAAYEKNVQLSPEQLGAIRKQAQEYGRLADEIARAKLNSDLKFEYEQLFRSPLEQQIASRLRGTGLGMNSSEANQMREIQRITDLRAGVKGFFDDFQAGLMKGDSFGKAFGNAILNALNKVLDKIIESGINSLVNAIVGGQGGSSGGGLLGSIFGSAASSFGTKSGFADMLGIGAANDNYAPGAITRSALPDIGSLTSSIGGSYSVANATSFIQQYASAIGIDPSTALRVARSEGLGAGIWQSNLFKNGVREPSFGPFQLLKGGQGTGFGAGLGNRFMEQTGLDPANPANWRQSTAFALDQAKANGWGAWYGAKNSGIGTWEGIDRSASKAVGALDKLSTGSTKAISGITNLGQAGNQATQGLSSFASNLNKLPSGGGIGGAPTGWNGILGSLFGGSTGWGAAGTWLAANPGQFIGLWANGGVFDRGISDYSNSIVDRPTFFKFASGSGLMGEAGPEAIMPLKRGSDGKLGVSMHGPSGGSGVTVNVINNAGAAVQTKERQEADGSISIDVLVDRLVANKLSTRGTAANSTLRGEFGAQKVLKRR